MAKKPETMTTTGGNPVADNQNSITGRTAWPTLPLIKLTTSLNFANICNSNHRIHFNRSKE